MGYLIRRLEAHEWKLLRELRLAALADTPIGFGMWHADALTLPDEYWQDKAARDAGDEKSCLFIAIDEATGDWIGMSGGFTPDEHSYYWVDGQAVIVVFSVYVAPAHRGPARGVSSLLFDAVIAWAGEAWPESRIVLGVHERNERAHTFYRRYGFVDNGGAIPYILDESAAILLMDYRPGEP
jgi:GNAT superfamily N-acetyltransferase